MTGSRRTGLRYAASAATGRETGRPPPEDAEVARLEGKFEDQGKSRIRRRGENAPTRKRIRFKPLGH